MHNALGVVAQLVRASACHAEGRGFEPRQSRQYLHRHPTVFFIKKIPRVGDFYGHCANCFRTF